MKKIAANYLIVLFSLFSGYSVNANNLIHWDRFFVKPDGDSLAILKGRVFEDARECKWGNSNNIFVFPMEMRKQLFGLIAEGNEFAFCAGLLVEKCLDGGDIEDFYRSAGLYYELQPVSFFKIIATEQTSESSFEAMLTMLPLDSVDNIDRQIAVIKKRKTLLKEIEDSSYTKIKRISLSSLEQQENLLLNVKREIRKNEDRIKK